MCHSVSLNLYVCGSKSYLSRFFDRHLKDKFELPTTNTKFYEIWRKWENIPPQKCKSTIFTSTIQSLKCHHHGNLMWNVNLQKQILFQKRLWNFLEIRRNKASLLPIKLSQNAKCLKKDPLWGNFREFRWSF